jgi:hypothetical protein
MAKSRKYHRNRHNRTKRQKIYNMRGCSKKNKKGGTNLAEPKNINAANPIYPNTGPKPSGFNFLGTSYLKGGNRPFFSSGEKGGLHLNPNCPLKQMGGDSSFVGKPWTPNSTGWPGVDGVDNSRNHYSLNTYQNDISRQMVNLGANPPFTGGKRHTRRHKRKYNKNKKGGAWSNFMTQDLVNLGRGMEYGIGTVYNTINGYTPPTNPLPWKDQMVHK